MKQKLTAYSIGIFLLFMFYSCQKELSSKAGEKKLGATNSIAQVECGTPLVKDLVDQGGVLTLGSLEVSNDEDFITLNATATAPDVTITEIVVVYGSQAHVQNAIAIDMAWDACQGPSIKDRVKVVPNLGSDSVRIPNSEFQADGCIWLGVWVTFSNNTGAEFCTYASPYDIIFGSAQWQSAFEYCRQDCPPEEDCGQLRTQTPGGWGAPPSGNNAGAYLHANFAGAFPSGLAIGCAPGNFYVRFTSAQAITDYLPAGGKPAVLTANFTNPASKDLKNTLVDHVIALTLSTTFDAYDADFGEAGINLEDMIIGSGTFQNWTVAQLLEEANKVLGGCGGTYTAEQLSEALDMINNNYIDGLIDNGFLVCPPPTER